MFINYRKQAKLKAIIFATLFTFGAILFAASGFAMTQIPHQDFAFWIMLGVSFVGVLTIFWAFIGFMFALVDYRELS
jgi:hypothetical protein